VTAPVRPEARRSLRILLADDNAVNQLLTSRLLERQGHQVVVCRNGREALERLDQEHVDLVLMDVQMPEMDGFEATAAIRTKEATTGAHVPILAMTAHALKGDRDRCLAAGMDDYVSKPIHPDKLFEAITRLLASRPGGMDGALARPSDPSARFAAAEQGGDGAIAVASETT
jgi:CheY-like chemotaxis protein